MVEWYVSDATMNAVTVALIEERKVVSKMFKVEVIADSSGTWCGNALTFTTREEAERYAKDLYARWSAVRQWRVVETVEANDASK